MTDSVAENFVNRDRGRQCIGTANAEITVLLCCTVNCIVGRDNGNETRVRNNGSQCGFDVQGDHLRRGG